MRFVAAQTSDDSIMKKTLAETNKNEKARPQIGTGRSSRADENARMKVSRLCAREARTFLHAAQGIACLFT